MMRMQKRNSSCDCGKTTKERGSFVTKSKVYETRSHSITGAQRTQVDDIISGVKDDGRITCLRNDNERLIKKMESTLITVPAINKSHSFRKSTINHSKTSTNKPCDNMIVRNGNARDLIGDALDDMKVANNKEIKLEHLECDNVRSNMNFEESCVHNENKVVAGQHEDESEKELREDKQNGVHEKCDDTGDINGRRLSKCENTKRTTRRLSSASEKNDENVGVNGYSNGGEHEHEFSETHNNKDELEFDLEEVSSAGGQNSEETENSDISFSCDRKKRKSNFEKIFDSYAEFGCYSDKRRSRKPPESYSPEPSRRLKLETLFHERSHLTISARVKKKVIRKPRQKGPIFHYLDLYIKNKDIKEKLLHQEEEETVLIDPSLIKQEEDENNPDEQCVDILPDLAPSSPNNVNPPHSPLTVTELSEIISSDDKELFSCSDTPLEIECSKSSDITEETNGKDVHSYPSVDKVDDEEHSNQILETNDTLSTLNVQSIENSTVLNSFLEILDDDDVPSSLAHEIPSELCNIAEEPPLSNDEIYKVPLMSNEIYKVPLMSSSINNDCCLYHNSAVLKKKAKVVSSKQKKVNKETPKKLTYDADVSRILGYRHNKGKNEFLVLFHNGTSNWIIQDDNLTVIPQYKEYFEHCEHDLPSINRLAYFIMNSVMDNDDDSCSETEINCCGPPSFGRKVSSGVCSPISFNHSLDHQHELIPIDNHREVSNVVHVVSAEDTSDESQLDHSISLDVNNDESSISLDVNNDESSLDLSPDTESSPVDIITNVDNYINGFSNGHNEAMSQNDLNELCNYVMSSRHVKLYPSVNSKEIVFKRDDEFMHIYLKNTKKVHDNIGRLDEHLNISTCEKLIYTLEDCAVDNTCKVVVISGIEDYFALKNIFDKLLKKPATIEGKNYEQDVSMLRYLIQTIRNFAKPICAVIKKTATGLPASMLSLFDMVFDERGENFVPRAVTPKPANPKKPKDKSSKKKKPDKKISSIESMKEEHLSENYQSYLFPRLMGLTESNESQIMGEGQKLNEYNNLLSCSANKRMFSQQLRKSLRQMKNNTKIQMKNNRGRKQSLNEEEFETIVNEENFHSHISMEPSVLMKAKFDYLEKEIQREKELTKQSMDELESILTSMGHC